MEEFLVRLVLYTFLPVLLGVLLLIFDRSVDGTARRIEAFLVPLLLIGVAGGGIGNFFAHFFISDRIAESIGWLPGSPFQLEVAFANLAFGVLGAVAAGRRDGFREATVLALFIFSVGASIVHVMDMVASNNFAPGNLVPGASNILKPGLLLILLILLGRTKQVESTTIGSDWQRALVNASVAALVVGATTFAIGYALDQIVFISMVGLGAAVVAYLWVILQSPAHELHAKWKT